MEEYELATELLATAEFGWYLAKLDYLIAKVDKKILAGVEADKYHDLIVERKTLLAAKRIPENVIEGYVPDA